jgi:acyl-CoA reductase-like NAD-dependent aldehyde dehydrogenase
MSSETVRKIGFTGSTAVGKALMAQASNVRGARRTTRALAILGRV